MNYNHLTLLPVEEKRKASIQWILARLAAERDARFVPQKWKSISEFLNEFNLVPGKHTYWRLTEVLCGQIHGLPSSFGLLVATDGISCYILQGQHTLFKGHVANFIKEPLENLGADMPSAKPQADAKPRRRREYRLEIYD